MKRTSESQTLPILLVLLVLLLVINPFLVEMLWGRWLFDLFYGATLIATVHVLHARWRNRLIALLLAIPTVVVRAAGYLIPLAELRSSLLIDSLFSMAFFAYTAVVIVRLVVTARISGGSIAGAFCAYLMIGLAWAALYSAVEILWPNSFRFSGDFVGAMNDPDRRLTVFIYYSFVTLTTIGYGDIIPVRLQAGTLAWVEAMVGQFYIAVFVAGLVGLRVAQGPFGREPATLDGENLAASERAR